MTRLNLLLLAAVVASAMWLVKTAYDTRRLFADIHRAEQLSQRLASDHKQHEAERELQATNQRVARTAAEKLAMRTVTPAVTMYEGRGAAPLTELPASAPRPAPKPAANSGARR